MASNTNHLDNQDKDEPEDLSSVSSSPSEPASGTSTNPAFARPSDRMFRRSRAAENRRRNSSRKEARFFKFVYTLASVGIFIVFIAIILVSKAYGQEAPMPVVPVVPDTTLTRPIVGDFSWLDLMGLAFVVVAGYAVFLKYGRKK